MQGIPCDAQVQGPLSYKGRSLSHVFIPDLVCHGKTLVELKAVSHLVDEHLAQAINNLEATGMELGLPVSFGHFPKIEIECYLNLNGHSAPERISD